MSLKRSEITLVVKLRRSLRILILLVLMHGLALLILAPLCEQFGWLVLLWVPVLFLSLALSVRRYALLMGKYAVIAITLKDRHDYVLTMADGRQIQAVLRRGSYVHPLLIILNLKLGKWPWYISVPLLPDSADEDILRQLRVRLRTMRDGELETLA